MAEQDALIDPETLGRTSRLFATKRTSFPPEVIRKLARDIVNRLTPPKDPVPAVITPESVEHFCDALVDPDPQRALDYIAGRRIEGMPLNEVYSGYIGAGAQLLGKRWDDDRLSFVDVTIGTGHLYALMRSLRSETTQSVRGIDLSKRALFATVPGEDHSVGITMAADLFRLEGWGIDLRVGKDHDELVSHAERSRPPVIGLSLSTDHRFDALARLVIGLRIVNPYSIIGVAPGGDLDRSKIPDLVDVDLLLEDVSSARSELEKLITMPRP